MSKFNNKILILISLLLVISCAKSNETKLAKIEYDWTPDEMPFSAEFCNEYHLMNGKKSKVICYSSEDKEEIENSLFFYYDQNNSQIIELKYKPLISEDTIVYHSNNKQGNCFISQDENWRMCFDTYSGNVISTHYGTNLPEELWSEFKKYRYNDDDLIVSRLWYTSDPDIRLSKSFFVYTEFDKNGNWVEREIYSSHEYLDDDDGVNIHQVSDSLKSIIMNDFITSPIAGVEPFIQRRKINHN